MRSKRCSYWTNAKWSNIASIKVIPQPESNDWDIEHMTLFRLQLTSFCTRAFLLRMYWRQAFSCKQSFLCMGCPKYRELLVNIDNTSIFRSYNVRDFFSKKSSKEHCVYIIWNCIPTTYIQPWMSVTDAFVNHSSGCNETSHSCCTSSIDIKHRLWWGVHRPNNETMSVRPRAIVYLLHEKERTLRTTETVEE